MSKPVSLRSGRDFQRVLTDGRSARRNGIVAVVVAGPKPEEPSRLGLAVRSTRGAVARNRTKRRLRAAFDEIEVPRGYDVVLRADDEVRASPFSEVVGHLGAALAQATERIR
ncbi:MAG: ribonuclease P protein component [Actinomycetota bacterium]